VANAYIESRVAVTRVLLIVLAVLVAGLFTWGALAVPEPAWFLALPLNALAVVLVLVLVGSRRRAASQGRAGGVPMALGGLAIAASVVVAFALGNAT
jgi:hypothetical protein